MYLWQVCALLHICMDVYVDVYDIFMHTYMQIITNIYRADLGPLEFIA